MAKKTSLDFEKHFLGNWKHHKNYLISSRNFYLELRIVDITPEKLKYFNCGYTLFGVRHLELIHKWYAHGIKKGWLACNYDLFEKYVSRGEHPEKEYNYRRRKYIRHPISSSFKYQKGEGHGGDPVARAKKEAWREHKGFDKDKKRPHWFSGSRRRRDYKHLSNCRHRRWEKECLRKEDYDSLSATYIKYLQNPWDWD